MCYVVRDTRTRTALRCVTSCVTHAREQRCAVLPALVKNNEVKKKTDNKIEKPQTLEPKESDELRKLELQCMIKDKEIELQREKNKQVAIEYEYKLRHLICKSNSKFNNVENGANILVEPSKKMKKMNFSEESLPNNQFDASTELLSEDDQVLEK